MIDKTSTALIVALISILGLTSCIRYNVAEPLDRFSSPEMGTADGNEITVTAGSTWFAEGEYENFILTGQALTGENAEAALLFHHTDGKSGYEVAFRNGAIDGTRKSGSLTSVRNLYRSLAEDGKWFDFEIAVRGHNIMVRSILREASRPSIRRFLRGADLPPFVTKRWRQKCPPGENVGERPSACA